MSVVVTLLFGVALAGPARSEGKPPSPFPFASPQWVGYSEWIVLCTGYDTCAKAGYSEAGYKSHAATSYWSQYTGHNCTNYVGYRLVANGLPNRRPSTLSGNAYNWGPSFGTQTDGNPAVGAVAWWDQSYSSTGHVAYVEKVISPDEILVSEDNWGGDFRWRRVTRTGGRWPQGFIHLNDVGAPVEDKGAYEVMTPTRFLDTRLGFGVTKAKVGAAKEVSLLVAGRGGLPSTGVGSVMLNVSVIAPSAAGYLTNYPSGTTRPGSRSVSYAAGVTNIELVPAKVGSDGRVRFYTSAATDLSVAVVGWYAASADVKTIAPKRVLDTRTGLATPKVKLPAGGTIDLAVAGAGVVPSSGAAAVVLDVSTVAPAAAGWLTAYPTGSARPTTAHLRYDANVALTGTVISRIGAGGKVTLHSTAATDVLVDLLGWVPTSADHVAMTPVRVVDSRSGVGATKGRVPSGGTVRIPVLGRGDVPAAGVKAVSVTVTPIAPLGTTDVTAYATGTARTSLPTLTVTSGRTRVNAAIVPVGADGSITVHSSVASYLVVDVQGYVTG